MNAADWMEVLRERRSVRHFKADAVPEEAVEQVLLAGSLAPSAGNVQPWHFYLIRSKEVQHRLVQAALRQVFLAECPVTIVVCADLGLAEASYGNRGRTLYCLQDTAAAVQNMLLCAHALGLGSCWVGAFSEEQVRAVLGLPEAHRPVAILPLGVPAEHPGRTARKPLKDIVSRIDQA